MAPSAEALYEYLWRAAGLEGKGTEARLRLQSMHDNDESRTFEEQLWYTETWIQLAKLLYDRRRIPHGLRLEIDEDTKEKGDIFVSRIDSFRYTESYRVFVIHQTSLLARLAILRVQSELKISNNYYSRSQAVSADSQYMLRRVIRSMYHAIVAEKKRTGMKLSFDGFVNYGRLEWLRGQRYRDIRALLCWSLAVNCQQKPKPDWAKAINWWAEGDTAYQKVEEALNVEGFRDNTEVEFASTMARSCRIAMTLARADSQSDRVLAGWLRRRAIEHPLLGCSRKEAGFIFIDDDNKDDDGLVPLDVKWCDSSYVGNRQCERAANPPSVMQNIVVFEKCGDDQPLGENERSAVLAELNL
jgi:hypothetical protein